MGYSIVICYKTFNSQKYRKNDVQLTRKFKEFMCRLYWILNSNGFTPGTVGLNKSAKGNEEIYLSRVQIIFSLLTPLTEQSYFSLPYSIGINHNLIL